MLIVFRFDDPTKLVENNLSRMGVFHLTEEAAISLAGLSSFLIPNFYETFVELYKIVNY